MLSELEGYDVKGFVCDSEAFMSIKTMVMAVDEDVDVLDNTAGIFHIVIPYVMCGRWTAG